MAIASIAQIDRRSSLAKWLGGLGIRIKLQVAFAAVSIMTVIATGVAIRSFSAAEHGVVLGDAGG